MRETAAIRAAMAKGMVEEHAQRRVPPPLTIALDITEAVFQEYVIEAAHYFGWKVAHFRRARVMRDGKETYETPVAADGRGWPDLCLARPGQLMFWELKAKKNQPTPEQKDWRDILIRAGAVHRFLHPRDWPEILEMLRW